VHKANAQIFIRSPGSAGVQPSWLRATTIVRHESTMVVS
jgi:hypothetical protein